MAITTSNLLFKGVDDEPLSLHLVDPAAVVGDGGEVLCCKVVTHVQVVLDHLANETIGIACNAVEACRRTIIDAPLPV